jgi:hypothetical protein
MMGFEDEVEQSMRRPYRYTNGRSKRTNIPPRAYAITSREFEAFCPL